MKVIVPKKKTIQGETTTPVYNREGKRRLKKIKNYRITYNMLREAAMEKILKEMEAKSKCK